MGAERALLPEKKLTKRQQWVKDRETYIGASECAAPVGEHPHLSAHELWRIKRGEHVIEETLPMRLGSFLEPFLGREFSRLTGLRIRKGSFCRHPKWPFMGCNPDFEIPGDRQPKKAKIPEKYHKLWELAQGRRGLLQTKYASFWPGQQWGAEGADEVPKHYLLQVAYELIVTGADYGILAVMIDGREIRPYVYTFNPDLFDLAHVLDRDLGKSMVFQTATFWNEHIVGGKPPAICGHPSDTEYVKHRRNEYETGITVVADEDTTSLCRELHTRTEVAKLAELQKAESANLIKQYLAENNAEALETEIGWFTWKKNAKGVPVFNTPFKSGKV